MPSRAGVESDEESLLEESLKVLREVGFRVSTPSDSRKSSLDVVARKDGALLVAKAVEDIDRVSEGLSTELRKVASALSATPLFIASRKGGEAVEGGIAYEKMGVWAVAPTTLSEAARGEGPIVYSKLGRFYVKIHGGRLREARERKGLSLGDLARLVGVSRKAIYEYERGSMDAALEVAARMEEVLESGLALPVDIFTSPITPPPSARVEEAADPLEKEVMSKFKRLGFEAFHFRKAPFNIIARSRRNRLLIRVAERFDRRAERGLKVVRSMADVSESLGLTIVKEEASVDEQGLLHYDEFKRVRSEPELVKIIG